MIKENLEEVREKIRQACQRSGRREEDVTLISVSKTKPVEMLKEAYEAGSRDFGENRVQEIMEKYGQMPEDVRWHMIGHLQKNKVRQVIDKAVLIHSVDTVELAEQIEKDAAKRDLTVDILLEVNVAEEESKFGFSFDECREMLAGDEWKKLGNVRICGLMGMATNTDNTEQIKAEFRSLNNFFQEAKATWFSNAEWFRELSMGMSHDYHEAIAAGSTLVRVGSKIFGERIY